MFNATRIKRFFSLFFFSIIIAALAACSGSGSSNLSGTSNTGTGSVALLLTDAPSDLFDEINITVTRAELLSDSGAVTLFQGERSFNLLDLTDARIFAIREGIAAGTYSKIRLTLTDIELVDYNGTDTPADDAIYHPKLPANGKLDLNPRGDFNVVAGGSLSIQIDMDANKSIHITKKGKTNVYNFRPVIFITVLSDTFTDRLVKLHGDIDAINAAQQSFKLCNTRIPVQLDENEMDENSRGCLQVAMANTTSVFDVNGKPAAFADLVTGEAATVFGYLQRDKSGDDDLSHDTSATTVRKHKISRHEDEQKDDDLELGDLVLKAKLIELGAEGGFLKLKGQATSVVDINDLFTMDVDPGQGLITPLNIKVQIQAGTILTNLQGEPVASTDIDTGKLVNARGVLDTGSDTLFASLIMVDTASSTRLAGTVGANPDNSCGFTLATAATGDRSIATDSNTSAFLVTANSSSSISVSDLSADQKADVYGSENAGTGCFDAHTIIAF